MNPNHWSSIEKTLVKVTGKHSKETIYLFAGCVISVGKSQGTGGGNLINCSLYH
ncbi:hypothetical protein [Desulfobacula sp.]